MKRVIYTLLFHGIFLIAISFYPVDIKAQSNTFEAKGILYLIDSDFNYGTFSTKIVESGGKQFDRIGSIPFPTPYDIQPQYFEQPISNAIQENSIPLAVNKEFNLAYVIESKGGISRETGATKSYLDKLPEGKFVSVIDIESFPQLKPEYKFYVAQNPTGIFISNDQKYLAISSETLGKELEIYELNEVGRPVRHISRPQYLGKGSINYLCWDSSGDFIYYVKTHEKEIGVVKVIREGGRIVRLDLSSEPVRILGHPSEILLLPDDKSLLVLDTKLTVSNNLQNIEGDLLNYKIEADTMGGKKLSFVSKASVAANARGLCLHPNRNTFFLIGNLQSSYHPFVENKSGIAQIEAYSMKGSGGQFDMILKQKIEGIEPRALCFDKHGKNMAIGFFQFNDFGQKIGGVQFFELYFEKNLSIKPKGRKFYTSTGINYLKSVY